MAITTQQLTGTMNGPEGALANGRLVLKLVGSDTEPGEMIIGNLTYEVDLDSSGSIPSSFAPWANGAGENGGTRYEATVYDAGGRSREIGILSIPETGEPHDIGALWNQNIPEASAVITPVPTASMSGVISGDIVLGDAGATFDVPVTGSAVVSGTYGNEDGALVVVTSTRGWMGIGATDLTELPSDDLEDTTDPACLAQFGNGVAHPHPDIGAGSVFCLPRGGSTQTRLLIGNLGDIGVKALVDGDWLNISALTNRNTTDVNNAYLKGRSWVEVSDTAATNSGNEVQAPVFSKISTGVYEIDGTNGLAIGYDRINLPRNELAGAPVINASVAEAAGVITLSTFDPADGITPMDIPGGRYVGIRTGVA